MKGVLLVCELEGYMVCVGQKEVVECAGEERAVVPEREI